MKYLLFIVIQISCLVSGDNRDSASVIESNKIALVLSGGGAQGIAHIGVLKAFEEYKIPIDLIVGTSAGAIVGGLYASGISIEKLEMMSVDGTFMKLFLGRNDLSDVPVWQRNDVSSGKFSIRRNNKQISGPPGLFNDQLIWRDLFLLTAAGNHQAKANFDSLFIPFRAIGADIVAQETVVFDSGSLAEAIRVSMSIPMVYPSVVKDGSILIDGGIYNNMPTNIARELGESKIIAVNVDDTPPGLEKMKDIFDYFDLFSSVFFSPTDSISISDWDYFINVNTEGFYIFDFSSGEALIKRGYDAGVKAAKKIRKNINRQLDINKMKNRQHKYQNAFMDKSIKHIKWVDHKTGELLIDEYKINTPFLFSTHKIKTIINSLYSTNTYDLIIPELTISGDTLKLITRKKATIQMIPDIKISSVDGFNLSGDWDYRFSKNQYSLRSKIGVGNYKSNAIFVLSPVKYISPYSLNKSHLIWELKSFSNYQLFNEFDSGNEIGFFELGVGTSVHHLINWDQQLTASLNFKWNHWTNFIMPNYSSNSSDLYPIFNLKYENNHIMAKTPVLEGKKIELDFLAGSNNSKIFYGFKGGVVYGKALSENKYFGIDALYKKMSDPTPLELTYSGLHTKKLT